MDELIDQIIAATGIDAGVARQATGIVINFLSNDGPADAVDAVLDSLPGARDLAAATGGGQGGIMGAFGDLTSAGLDVGDIQDVARIIVDYARATAGAEKVDALIAGIPGLDALI